MLQSTNSYCIAIIRLKPLSINIDQSAMPIEIERKFIAQPAVLQKCPQGGTKILQGYLSTKRTLITLRVRRAGEQALLAWKRQEGRPRTAGDSRTEIPSSVAHILLTPRRPCTVESRRRATRPEHAGRSSDVDAFGDADDGLILAEDRTEELRRDVILPPWIGSEVTSDPSSEIQSSPLVN